MPAKKTKLLLSGILFLIGSLFILSSQSGSTAAVVGVGKIYPGVLYVSGLFLLGSAFVIFAGVRSIDEHVQERHAHGSIDAVSAGHAVGRLTRKEPMGHKRYVVVDSSAVTHHTPEEIRSMLSGKDAYTTRSVLDELGNKLDGTVVRKETKIDPGYKSLRKKAKEYLEQTPKHQLYMMLVPIIDARLHGKEMDLNRQQITAFREGMGTLLNSAKKGVIPTNQGDKVMLEKTREYLVAHYKVSDTDVDVLATAMHLAKENPGSHVTIAAEDTDFREVIKIIKSDDPALGKRLVYKNDYR